MDYIIEPNGNLTFIANAASMEDLQTIKDRVGEDDKSFLVHMLDDFGLSPNGHLYSVRPEDIGALTDAPILSDEVDYLDNGDVDVHGKVWWYPNYMVSNFANVLLETGRVTFTAAQ